MRRIAGALAAMLVTSLAVAQTSTGFKLEEHVFNAGGHPEAGAVLTSASYRVTLDSLGESVVGAGTSSLSYRVGGGFGSGYPPPGEVLNLRFADDVTLVWDPERSVGVYNLYRDGLSSLSGSAYGQCEQQDLAGESATDSDTPTPAGAGFFYLVTAENRLSEEGTKGWDHGGLERQGEACP